MDNSRSYEKLSRLVQDLTTGSLHSQSLMKLLTKARDFQAMEDSFWEQRGSPGVEKRIALLASRTVQPLADMLRVFLARQGVRARFFIGSYDGIRSGLLSPDIDLVKFAPEFILLFPHHSDLMEIPEIFSNSVRREDWLESTCHAYAGVWDAAHVNFPSAMILQANFAIPAERALGNLETALSGSATRLISELNDRLLSQSPKHVAWVDFEGLSAEFGKRVWFDSSQYFMSKLPFSMEAMPMVCQVLSRLIASFAGKPKKCLVLDLDHTLWGGVIGDDGIHGINLDPNHPIGEAFRAFQTYVKKLSERGVILAVCSKNDEVNAKAPFRSHAQMVLKLDDIACFVANWENKADNLREIARQLNIGTDSLVFFDDNPAEREIVRQFAPEVEVVEVPVDPVNYVQALHEARCFEWPYITEEDTKRTSSYVTNRQREEVAKSVVDYPTYLRSLEMRARVSTLEPLSFDRVLQLINKSNQFNLRTRRYTDAELASISESRDARVIAISLKDRFGDFGIISVLILKKEGLNAFIDTWVMSCRVLKRGIEVCVLDSIVRTAREWGCGKVHGEFLPTEKNQMVASLLPSLGFTPDFPGSVGNFHLPLESEFKFPEHFIQIEID